MSKPKKLKLKDFIYKPFIDFVLIQTIILFIPIFAYNPDTPISFEDCYSSSIIVEEKILDTGGKGSNFFIVFKGEIYQFSEVNYKARELDELISVGDSINIHYIESDDDLFIVDARDKNQTYVDIMEYNRDSQLSNTLTIISFLIIELIFLVLSDVKFYLCEAKEFYQKLNKKIKKLKKLKHYKYIIMRAGEIQPFFCKINQKHLL